MESSQKLNQEILQKILEDIKSEHQIHNLTFLYITDIGLRAYNLTLENYNTIPYDLKGFYVGTQENYLSVIRPPKEIKISKEKREEYENQFKLKIEYEFLDIRTYLQCKIESRNSYKDIKSIWLQSPVVYTNKFSEKQGEILKKNLTFPITPYWGKIKGIAQKMIVKKKKKQDDSQETLTNIQLLSNIISLYNYLHMKENSEFIFNIEQLKQKKDTENLQNLLNFVLKSINNKEDQDQIFTQNDLPEYLSYIEKVNEIGNSKNVSSIRNVKPEIQEEEADNLFLELMNI